MRIFIVFFAFLFASTVLAHEEQGIVPPLKEVVSIDEKGAQPSTLSLGKLDSSVFFLNVTRASLLTLIVDFGKREHHCASGNLEIKNGRVQSKKPFGPKDFALMCFPDPGEYKVKILGVPGREEGVWVTINVVG